MKLRGFTLLELIVASALTVLLAGAAAVLLIRGMTAARRTEAALQQMFLLERAAEKLGRELRNSVPVADRHFEGAQGAVSFVVSEGPTALISVRYRLLSSEQGNSLIREWQPFPAGEEPPQTATLLTRVMNFSILYGIIKPQGNKQLLTWSESWSVPPTEPARLPELVQVRLDAQDSKGRPYSVTREFLIPQGVLRSPPGEL